MLSPRHTQASRHKSRKHKLRRCRFKVVLLAKYNHRCRLRVEQEKKGKLRLFIGYICRFQKEYLSTWQYHQQFQPELLRTTVSDSVPIGVPQTAHAAEPSRPARKSGNRRDQKCMRRRAGVQEKKRERQEYRTQERQGNRHKGYLESRHPAWEQLKECAGRLHAANRRVFGRLGLGVSS